MTETEIEFEGDTELETDCDNEFVGLIELEGEVDELELGRA